jgi:hypothetical protein
MKELQPDAQVERLSKGDQRTACLLGVFLFCVAAYVFLAPPVRLSEEENETKQGVERKRARSSTDTTTLAIVLVSSAIGLWGYALNGLRIVRFGVGSLTADASGPASKAGAFFAQENPKTIPVAPIEDPAPEPTESEEGTIIHNGEKLAVYKLDSLPLKVLIDALTNWPGGAEKRPVDLATFEFAARKPGQGNNPWTIKFRGKDAVSVSYGGKSKTAATTKN